MADTAEIIVELKHNTKEFQSAMVALTTTLRNAQKTIDGTTSKTKKYSDSESKAKDEIDKTTKSLKDKSKAQKESSAITSGLIGKIGGMVTSLGAGQLAILGVTGGIFGMIGAAHDLNMRLSTQADDLTKLTDSYGSTGQAVSSLYTAWGNSLASIGTLKGAMLSLGDAGVQLGETFTQLTAFTGSLEQMTGESATAWAGFLGNIQVSFKSTIGELRDLTSAMIASGLNGAELSIVMKSVADGINNIAYIAGDGQKSVLALTRSISRTSAVFKKLGIDAQTAGNFINGMLDPAKFEQNLNLMGRLGISTQDYLDALSSGQGKEAFTDKMLKNLPRLAKELAHIPDPLQRFNLMKDMGLDPKIAAKFAKTTAGEVQDVVDQIKVAQKEQKALEDKEQKAKANAARFNDALEMLKMKALMPLMQFVNSMMGPWMSVLSSLAGSVSKILSKIIGMIGGPLQEFAIGIADAAKLFEQGNIEDFAKKLGESTGKFLGQLEPVLTSLIKGLVPVLVTVLKTVFIAAGKAIIELFKTSPIMGALFGGAAVAKVAGGGSIIKGASTIGQGAISAGKFALGASKGAAGKAINIGASGATKAGSVAGASLSRFSPMLSQLSKVAGPIGLIISSVTGGLQAMSNSAEYFYKTLNKAGKENVDFSKRFDEYFDKNFNEARLDKLLSKRNDLTKVEEKELAYLEKLKRVKKVSDEDKSASSAIGQDVASFAAGAGTLGIAPLIDSIFGTSITAPIANGIYEVAKFFEPLFDALGVFGVLISPMGALIHSVTDNWDFLMGQFEIVKFKLSQFVITLKEEFETFINSIKFHWANMVDTVTDGFNSAVSWIKGVRDSIVNNATKAWNFLTGLFSGLGSYITPIATVFSFLGKIISNFVGDVISWFSDMVAKIKSFFTFGSNQEKRIAENQQAIMREIKTGATFTVGELRSKLLENAGRVAAGSEAEKFLNSQQQALEDAINARKEKKQIDEEMKRNQRKQNAILGGIGGHVKGINDKMDKDSKPPEVTITTFDVFGAAKIGSI